MTNPDFHSVESELERLTEKVLDGKITETIDGEEVTLSAEEPERAAEYSVDHTDIYDEDPDSVIKYAVNVAGIGVPDSFPDYEEGERGMLRAMAKTSFKNILEENIKDKNMRSDEGDME